MTTEKTAVPDDVYVMPWERKASSDEHTAASKLQRLFDSEEPTGTPEEEDEPVPADAGDTESEEDEEESEDDADGRDEDDTDTDEEEEESEGDDEDEEAQLPATVKVKVDGEEVEITLDEALKGYSRTADYTRKTQALATDRKSFEAEQQAVRGEREAYKRRIEMLDQALAESTPQEPDWDRLYATNRVEYAAQRARFDEIRQKRQALAQEHQRVTMQQQADAERAKEARLVEESQKLLDAIPEWKDAARASKGKSDLLQYATDAYGFTAEQLDAVEDHRVLVMLHKAMQFDRMSKKGSQLRDKVVAKKGEKVLKPGAQHSNPKKKANRSKVQKTRARLARSGDMRDAAAHLTAIGILGD